MKSVSAVEARQGFGKLLNMVSLRHESFVIERAGRKLAVISPYEEAPIPPMAREPGGGKLDIRGLAGLGADLWTSHDADEYIRKERAAWE